MSGLHIFHRWVLIEWKTYPVKYDPFTLYQYRCRCGTRKEVFR